MKQQGTSTPDDSTASDPTPMKPDQNATAKNLPGGDPQAGKDLTQAADRDAAKYPDPETPKK